MKTLRRMGAAVSCVILCMVILGGCAVASEPAAPVRIRITGRPADDIIRFDTQNPPVLQLGYAAQGAVGDAVWDTSDPYVASIDSFGRLQVHRSGTVTVFLDFDNGGDSFVLTIESDVLDNGTWLSHGEGASEFTLNVPAGQNVKILQLTDTQIIDVTQLRSDNRLSAAEKQKWEDADSVCYWYVREMVAKTKPDFIVVTGDTVYGEFDDSGQQFAGFVEQMDSFGIYWTLVWGNHDNESDIGIAEQLRMLSESKYCLFYPGNTDGNCNFSIDIRQNARYVKTLFFVDTNACVQNRVDSESDVIRSTGATEEQRLWYADRVAALQEEHGTASGLLFMHIPIAAYRTALQEKYPSVFAGDPEIPENTDGDFGCVHNDAFDVWDTDNTFFETAAAGGTDGIFVGHNHSNNASILYNGVRLTWGLKTGTFDSFTKGELGGTVIEITADSSFSVRHEYAVSKDTETFEQAMYSSETIYGALFDAGQFGGLALTLTDAPDEIPDEGAGHALLAEKTQAGTLYTCIRIGLAQLRAGMSYEIAFDLKVLSGSFARIVQLYDADTELLATIPFTGDTFSTIYTPATDVSLIIRIADNVADSTYALSLDNISVRERTSN